MHCLFLLSMQYFSKHVGPPPPAMIMYHLLLYVNFMSVWLDRGVLRYLVKLYFWVCRRGCFQMKFESTDSGKHLAFPQCGQALSNQRRAWIEQKGRGRQNLALPARLMELGPQSFPAPHAPGTQASELRLNHTSSPGSPACRWQSGDLTASPVVWTWFLIINK